jgi:hypothetical protein
LGNFIAKENKKSKEDLNLREFSFNEKRGENLKLEQLKNLD